jgi:tRNA threonylcarbamoyl adenosine modification protein YjeE
LRLAEDSVPGDVVSLEGPLGAGKTTFARGFVRHFGGALVNSPSYTIAQVYPTRPLVVHLDLYRLTDPDEAEELGLADYFGPDSLALVEWGDRFPELLPENHRTIRFTLQSDGSRRIDSL